MLKPPLGWWHRQDWGKKGLGPCFSKARDKARELCWDPGFRDPNGLPNPGNSVYLKGDLERLTQLELGQVWVMDPAPSVSLIFSQV